MLDIGLSEMVVIGVVALVVVGPKDLPMMFRKVGNFVGKARGMARDFQNAMTDAADQSGVNEIKKSFDDATNMKDFGLDDVTNSMKDYGSKVATGEPKASEAKTTAKKAPAKKPAAKKAAKPKAAPAKKPAASAKKPASKAKATAAKKPAAKKPTAKKAT